MQKPWRQQVRRRDFLRHGAAAAGILSAPWIIPASALGADGKVAPSQRVTVGLIGRGAMGSGHLHRLAGDPQFQLLAVCDVDRTRREDGRSAVETIYAKEMAGGQYRGCAAINDYRELLARPDVDAVVVATPDHWHALQSIDAAKAGKDVYCEKPISMTIQEGRRLVEVMRRYGRVFQTGTQYRSIPTVRHICQFIRDGRLGKVKTVFTLLNNLGLWLGGERFKPYAGVVSAATAGKVYVPMDFALPAEPVPAGLDWDLWVGPGAWHPYNRLFHTNPSPGVVPWSFCEDFGVTSLTWHLAHSADVIQWALGVERSGPVEVLHPKDGPYPTLSCRYASGTLLHFVDHWGQVKDLYHAVPANARLAGNFGGLFVGERGWITTMSTGGQVEGGPDELFQDLALKTREVNIGANNHHANWLECIRTRQAPSCEEEIGHRSASVGHLVNAACWAGSSLKWDPERERFAGPEEANRLCSRAMRAPWRI